MRHICYHWELGTPDAAYILASNESYTNHLIQLPNTYMDVWNRKMFNIEPKEHFIIHQEYLTIEWII